MCNLTERHDEIDHDAEVEDDGQWRKGQSDADRDHVADVRRGALRRSAAVLRCRPHLSRDARGAYSSRAYSTIRTASRVTPYAVTKTRSASASRSASATYAKYTPRGARLLAVQAVRRPAPGPALVRRSGASQESFATAPLLRESGVGRRSMAKTRSARRLRPGGQRMSEARCVVCERPLVPGEWCTRRDASTNRSTAAAWTCTAPTTGGIKPPRCGNQEGLSGCVPPDCLRWRRPTSEADKDASVRYGHGEQRPSENRQPETMPNTTRPPPPASRTRLRCRARTGTWVEVPASAAAVPSASHTTCHDGGRTDCRGCSGDRRGSDHAATAHTSRCKWHVMLLQGRRPRRPLRRRREPGSGCGRSRRVDRRNA